MNKIYADKDYICMTCGTIFNQDNQDGSDAAYCINGHDNWISISECSSDTTEDIIKLYCQNTSYNYLKVIEYINNMKEIFLYLTEQELQIAIKEIT